VAVIETIVVLRDLNVELIDSNVAVIDTNVV
jgi:hypothetical protein